jgi:hypothetical protein
MLEIKEDFSRLKYLLPEYYLWFHAKGCKKESGFIIVTGVVIKYCSPDFLAI